MAITMRNGVVINLDKNKLLPGEIAITSDTGLMVYCYAAGLSKELATIEDVLAILNTNPTAYTALLALISELETNTALSASILSDLAYLKTGMIGAIYPSITYGNQIFYKIV